MSPVQIDRYKVRLFFKRLFADPRIFADDASFARLMLEERGLDRPKIEFIVEPGHFRVTDLKDNLARPVGTAHYLFQGKKIRSEYMQNATVSTEYLDLGSGKTPDEHYRFWMDGSFWTMPFTLENFEHGTVSLEMPDAESLFQMVKGQAQPTAFATLELGDLDASKFDVAVSYLESRLGGLARKEGMSLEVYAARYLDASEKSALEKRLARQSTDATVYVILGRS